MSWVSLAPWCVTWPCARKIKWIHIAVNYGIDFARFRKKKIAHWHKPLTSLDPLSHPHQVSSISRPLKHWKCGWVSRLPMILEHHSKTGIARFYHNGSLMVPIGSLCSSSGKNLPWWHCECPAQMVNPGYPPKWSMCLQAMQQRYEQPRMSVFHVELPRKLKPTAHDMPIIQ